MALREVWTSRTFAKDANGKKTGVRIFQADVTSAAAAASEFESNAVYRTFPPDPSLTFDAVAYQVNGTGAGYTVTVTFSNFKAGRFAVRPPVDSTGYYQWQWGDREVPAEVLGAVREKRTVGTPGGGEQTFEVWVGKKIKIYEVRPQRIFKRRITGYSVEDFDAIATQRNRIHNLGGLKWQFIGGNVRDADGSSFDVTYTWELDKGTEFPDPFVDWTQGGPKWAFVEFYRKPSVVPPPGIYRMAYEQIGVIVPAEDPRISLPRPTSMFPYAYEPEGWRSLPGTDVLA